MWDTGLGIPDAELPKLFDRFHRVEGAGDAVSKAPASAWRWCRKSSRYTAARSVEKRSRRRHQIYVTIPLGRRI